MIRDADGLLAPAVEQAIAALDTTDADAAAVQLARRYAAIIDGHRDEAWGARWLMPLLLDCLESLGATPAARAQLTKGTKPSESRPNGLAKLRAAR